MFEDGEQRIITIADEQWRVFFVSGLLSKDRAVLGRFDRRIKMIFIDVDQPPDTMIESIIHEVLHVLSNPREMRSVTYEEWTEKTATAIASVLSQLNLISERSLTHGFDVCHTT